jgi:hypothetical protein
MTLIMRPGFQFDDDASTYIEAVEAADTQALETATRYAINDFVIGCKQDGIWSAIKASCILAGARTLTGALVPLVGTAPTNPGGVFVSGDYDRETGLIGDGSSKYLESNYTPVNAVSHMGVYSTTSQLTNGRTFIGASDGMLFYRINRHTDASFRANMPAGIISISSAGDFIGFGGVSQSASGLTVRAKSQTVTSSATGGTLNNLPLYVFAQNSSSTSSAFISSRLAFYSIGESLDLALLDARVTDLINAFAAAIP